MATIKLEKQFNFKAGLVRLTVDSDNQVDIATTDRHLLSADFRDSDTSERFFYLAAARLLRELLDEEPDIPRGLIPGLHDSYKKGVFPPIDSHFWMFQEPFSFDYDETGPFENLVIRANFEIKSTALPNDPAVYLAQIKLKLENGRQFTMMPGEAFGDYFNLNDPVSVDEETGTRGFVLCYDFPLFYAMLHHNDYFPANWTELKGATVLETEIVVCDLEDPDCAPPVMLESGDVVSEEIIIDYCTVVDERVEYEECVSYNSMEQEAQQNV